MFPCCNVKGFAWISDGLSLGCVLSLCSISICGEGNNILPLTYSDCFLTKFKDRQIFFRCLKHFVIYYLIIFV